MKKMATVCVASGALTGEQFAVRRLMIQGNGRFADRRPGCTVKIGRPACVTVDSRNCREIGICTSCRSLWFLCDCTRCLSCDVEILHMGLVISVAFKVKIRIKKLKSFRILGYLILYIQMIITFEKIFQKILRKQGIF